MTASLRNEVTFHADVKRHSRWYSRKAGSIILPLEFERFPDSRGSNYQADMAQIFHPSMNALSKVSIFGAVFIIGAAGWAIDAVHCSPWVTQVDVAREQPVPFSHKHHVAGLGIDCRFCHNSVEVAASAGIPSTKVCMTCHSVLFKDSDILEPVRESFRSDESIEWARVHDLPDYVYFDHSIHLAKGVGCTSCHGRVDQMPLMWREHTLNMDWCLDCHRNPAPHIRPKEALFDMDWKPPALHDPELLMEEYDVAPGDNCTICHR